MGENSLYIARAKSKTVEPMWPSGLYKRGSDKIGVEEFHQIFHDLYADLCLYAMKFVGDYDTSKDVVQEVLYRFWIENEKLLNKNLIKPYLYKAVKNKALNHNKREQRSMGLDEFFLQSNSELNYSDNSTAVEELSFKTLLADFEKAVDEMPEQRRKIFQMSRMHQMKHKEIAKELNISPKTVETQIYRSLLFLKEKLSHYL